MNAIPYIIWGITCLIAAVGTVLVFRSEDRAIIAEQRTVIRTLQGDLNLERSTHLRTKARLSQLMPVPTLLNDEVYDHELAERERSLESRLFDEHLKREHRDQ